MQKKQSGFLIVEVLISIAILGLIVVTLVSTLSVVTIRSNRSKFESDAVELTQQAMELSRNALISNWDSYPTGEYFPIFDAGSQVWELEPGVEGVLRGRFTRKIEIDDVCRTQDTGNRISCPGGTKDTKSRLISIKITWNEKEAVKEVEAELMLYKGNY